MRYRYVSIAISPTTFAVYFYKESFPDEMCISCHGKEELQKVDDGEVISLHVDVEEHRNSAHGKNPCIKCHTDISVSRDPVCRGSGKVDCSICHSEQVEDYQISQHGTYYAAGNPIAPYCTDCHGVHGHAIKRGSFLSYIRTQHTRSLWTMPS